MSLHSRHRFLPLSGSGGSSAAPALAGVIFDMDGTLTSPQPCMFAKIRTLLGVPAGTDILTHVATSTAAMALVERVEDEAMRAASVAPGVEPLLEYLARRGIRKAILTRNYPAPVRHLLTTHLGRRHGFDPIITREFLPPKPAPDGIRHIAHLWGCEPAHVIMVGDSIDDIAAGRSAGAATVLVGHAGNTAIREHDFIDCVVERLDQLIEVLEDGFSVIDRPGEVVKEELEEAQRVLEQ